MKNSFTNLFKGYITIKKNQPRVSGFKTPSTFFNIKSIYLVIAFLIITGTAESNWIPQEKTTSTDAMSSITSDEGKKDSLPKGVTQDWLNNLRDENGNSIVSESNLNRDSQELPEDPEGDAFQRKVFNGQGIPDHKFGYSVSSAGDVNGDGYFDIIVCELGYATGRAYIFFGGININTVADVVMTYENKGSGYGMTVSSAGDVNGDGYSDVIVGLKGYSELTGIAFVYLGGASMDNIADVTITGENKYDQFGSSASSAGDVNSDGYSDVIIGESGSGKIYVYFGGESINNTPDVILIGSYLSSAGDVNGDGYSDVIVSEGDGVILYFGGASMDNIADVTMTVFSGVNSVSTAGDVNGDGYSDVIVGTSLVFANTGKAYIFLGGRFMDNIVDLTIEGENTNNYFGNSVSSAGDVNGDGYSDVIIGAFGNSNFAGKAYVYLGGFSMNNTVDMTMKGEESLDQFGNSVSSAGDVNGDGYDDVIVGADWYNFSSGRIYLYDYFMKNEMIPDLTMTGVTDGESFGYSVSSAGDVNGDGYSDVIVGASAYSSSTGRAYIYFGGSTFDNTADVTLTGETTGSYFGSSVSAAGDLNSDGYSDVIIGAYGYSSSKGRAYVYFGGISMNNVADVTMTGEAINSFFGSSVSTVGDVNGDGYFEVIVGATGYSSSKGRAYLYFGGVNMNNTADLTMTGDAGDELGKSVSSAGDVNGDGYSDVIIGAFGYSTGGGAHIYFGGISMDNIADVTMVGETIGDAFGFSVSSAGDVNGDGYSDVIVGAVNYNSITGRAYLYYGGYSFNNTADIIMTGETASNFFGISVSSVGDVNNDGYSDVIIGAYGFSSSTGRTYVYFGGSSMDNIEDITMTGETTSNHFGTSVSSVGDVNGDGYSDLIVGAFTANISGSAYIYFGSAISVKPILNYVKDVPNDQGGYLNLKFAKCSFDVPVSQTGGISYQIDRSVPPNANGYQWISVANVSGTYSPFYIAEIHTPYDSGTSGNNTFFFRVTAVSNNTGDFWRSNIVSGYSLDNIAPPSVSPFTATAAGANINLNWGSNSAPDLLNYVLFRSTNPSIDPYTETPLTSVTTTTYVDTSPLSGFFYYFIVAQDIHGNYSPIAVTEAPNTTLNLTMFMEGFYDSGTDTQISDTITVQLRNTVSPFAIVDEAKSVLSSSGNAVLKFVNTPSGNYYLCIRHRNSIETWSASGVTISSGGSVNYNLSTTSSQAYGSNMPGIDTSPIRYGIFSGDMDQDGFVNLTDIVNVYNNASAFVNGYVSSDMNGDNLTDLTDVVITFNNASSFVSAITP